MTPRLNATLSRIPIAFEISDASPRSGRTPSPPSRKIDISKKIPDTSLFAELVKDKHKRDKVLKEIIDKQEVKVVNSMETSNNNNIVVIDMVDGDATNTNVATTTMATAVISGNDDQTANGVKEKMCLVDIPMPGISELL